jgi:chaperonin GroES
MLAPTKDLVLIKADPPKEKTASGLYITEEWKSLPPTGVVLAIGPDVKDVKVGDNVLFERYASVILRDEERLCKENHILARIQNG